MTEADPPLSLSLLAERWRLALPATQVVGEIRFWGFAAVRPHDQGWCLEGLRLDGAALELLLRHASGQGQIAVLRLLRPEGLAVGPQGLTLERAERLSFDGCEAWREPDGLRYRVRSAQGEGGFEIRGRPALTLGF